MSEKMRGKRAGMNTAKPTGAKAAGTGEQAEKAASPKRKTDARHMARRIGSIVTKVIIYFVLICIGFVYLEPILEMIAKALMSAEDIIDPSVTWIPHGISFDNLKVAAQILKLGSTLKNSILFSGGLALCQTLVSALTAYGLSRFEFKGKNFWFVMIILTFILPVPVLMVPRLMMLVTAQTATGIQLIGTVIPQAVMAILGQGVYSAVLILIFYTSFNSIPKVLDEAAQIDGASSMKVFWSIVVRMSGSTLLVVFLFSFVWNWNETYITSTLLRGNLALLPAKLDLFNSEFEGLVSSMGSAFRLNEAYKMSATLISISPLLLLYVFVQRQFIQGIENTGITGE